VDADGQHPVVELERLLERVREGECDVAVGSRFATGGGFAACLCEACAGAEAFAPSRYMTSAPRRFGTALLRRAMRIVLRRPFLDATSGMYAVNAKALPVLAQPYTTEDAEGEWVLRLRDA